MNIQLIAHTPNPEQVVATAARLCYSNSATVNTLIESLTPDKCKSFVKKLEALGHQSPFEHVSFTFAVEGISRVVSHELVRHRIANYSQRSQRYCAEGEFDFVTPASIQNSDFADEYDAFMKQCNAFYQKMVEAGIPKEDARYVLPNATHTRIIFTMNLRSLWHFMNMRCCTRAQNEMRAMANEILRICKEKFPLLFAHAGASCVKGYCPEGNMCCGKAPTMEQLLAKYNS